MDVWPLMSERVTGSNAIITTVSPAMNIFFSLLRELGILDRLEWLKKVPQGIMLMERSIH